MRWAQSLRRWTMRGIHATILGAALLSTASMAFAQAPAMTAAANLPSKTPGLRQEAVSSDLPVVKVQQEFRATLSAIQLYVKTPTGDWKLHESIGPQQTRFSCKVAQDGEYWFMLATVDRVGKMEPANLSTAPVSRRVVVDTTPPSIQVEPWTSPDGELCLRCIVQDANPDHASLKAVAKTGTGEVPLQRVPNQTGVFRVAGLEARYPVIITMNDLAGNEGKKEINLADLVHSPKTLPNVAQTTIPAPVVEPMPVLPSPRFDPVPPPLPNTAPLVAKIETPASAPTMPVLPPAQRTDFPTPPAPITPMPVAPPIEAPQTNTVVNRLPTPAVTEFGNHGAIPHQLINTTRANVDFRLDQVGPSGMGKVEIYMTPDKGQTWHRVGEHPDKRSPLEVSLPGDGEYGIRISVTNGNGFGGKAPVRGDAPHCTIEVDTMAPFVQLRSTELLPSTGQVELRWNAQDKNLGTEPVTLLYRTKADGPWQVIARNVKNEGVHRWAFPRDVGTQFFFKIEVADRAGNVAHDVSHQPVLIDMSEPRVSVVGVSGSGAVRPVSGGN